jgi:hypothetical protein
MVLPNRPHLWDALLMRTALRYLLAIVLGAAVGVGAAFHVVRAGAFGAEVAIGPWRTGRDFGVAAASARTRAVVALGGLLALPAREARYYTAAVDDAGQPLDGRCRYRVSGGPLPARWWSLTMYDAKGYLAGPGPYSVESAQVQRVRADERAMEEDPLPPHAWQVEIGRLKPWEVTPLTLLTDHLGAFQLTLRLYLPADGGRGDPPRSTLPSIVKVGC